MLYVALLEMKHPKPSQPLLPWSLREVCVGQQKTTERKAAGGRGLSHPALPSPASGHMGCGLRRGSWVRRRGEGGGIVILFARCTRLPNQPEEEKRNALLLFVLLGPPSVLSVPDTCTVSSEPGTPVRRPAWVWSAGRLWVEWGSGPSKDLLEI